MSDHLDQLRQLAKEPPVTHGLPDHLRKLHRRVMEHTRQERARPQATDDEGRRWGPAGGTRKHRSG